MAFYTQDDCVGFQIRPVDKKPCRLYRFQLYFQTVSAFKVVLSMKSHVGSTFFMSAPKPVDKCNSDFKFDCCRLQGTWVDWCWLHGFQSVLLSATRDLSLSIKKAKFSQKIRNFRKKKRNFRDKKAKFSQKKGEIFAKKRRKFRVLYPGFSCVSAVQK